MENHSLGRWERIKRFWDIGVALAITVAALSLGRERLVIAFTSQGLADIPVAQMSGLLLIETVVLLFLWIRATSGEYQMDRDHFTEFIPAIPKSTFYIVIGLAILGGSLCYFSDRLIVYSAIFVCFKFFEIWGIWVRDTRLKEVLASARSKTPPEDKRREAWLIIEKYHFEKPHTQLAITGLFFSFVALILALSGELLARDTLTTWLLSAGYVVMMLNIAIPEIIYGIWRRERDYALREEYV